MLACWLALLCAWPATAASLLDPRLNFRTLTTAHFIIYFHQGEDTMAARLAAIAEDTWPKVGRALGVEAPRRTHVILADQSELANGWATPLPYNTIFVTAAAPAGSEFIGRNYDWMQLVFVHEFTHIVHLDRSERWARVFRGLFGRTPIAFPNLFLPHWMTEGLAQYQESAITGDGRLHAGDFRAIEREAGRVRGALPIDRANGGLIDWPGGSAAYAYGLGFHEFLADRFGADRFGELAGVTAGIAPFAGAAGFGRVYGQSAKALWRDYTRALEAVPPAPATAGARPVQLTRHGQTVLGPRFLKSACAACDGALAYTIRNPRGFPSLQQVGSQGGLSTRLTRRYLGSTTAVGRQVLIFDQQEFRRNAALYSDLYRYDLATGRVAALTREARLQDPDLSPDESTIVAVRHQNDRRDLVTLSWDGHAVGPIRVVASDAWTYFNAPRWSPDGRTIAVSRHRDDAQADLVIVEVSTGVQTIVAAPSAARIVTPTWRPDGRAIVAAADFGEDTFNLYEFSATDPGTPPVRLTSVTGGASWPEVSADGKTLVFVGYTFRGFDLFSLPYPNGGTRLTASISDAGSAVATRPRAEPLALSDAHPYSPWQTIAPTTWMPVLQADGQLRAGVAVNGVDVLGRHAYAASATWLVDSPSSAPVPPASQPDWAVSYVYDRWRPMLFSSVSTETQFFSGRPDAAGQPDDVTVRQQKFEVGVYVPVRHARRSHRVIASLVGTSDRALAPADLVTGDRVSVRVGGSTSTAQLFGYSISPERGVSIGGTAAIIRRALGSSQDATVLTTDARAYVPGAAPHHVVALRGAAGIGLGADGGRQLFVLGGAGPNVDVIDFSREAFSLLRGFPANSFAGSRIATMNVEYRAPLARPQRGFGIWPAFLQTIHATAFADAGAAWTAGVRPEDVKTSLGGEVSFELVGGYSFPLTVAVGSGWGHDVRDGSNRGTIYFRIGRVF